MSTPRRGPPEPKLWQHELPGGWIVLAGRTDADNDRLSLKVARPNDWWFHVRGMPGSHVVLRVPGVHNAMNALAAAAAAFALDVSPNSIVAGLSGGSYSSCDRQQ